MPMQGCAPTTPPVITSVGTADRLSGIPKPSRMVSEMHHLVRIYGDAHLKSW